MEFVSHFDAGTGYIDKDSECNVCIQKGLKKWFWNMGI